MGLDGLAAEADIAVGTDRGRGVLDRSRVREESVKDVKALIVLSRPAHRRSRTIESRALTRKDTDMDEERGLHDGRVPLPGSGDADRAGQIPTRRDGIRQARRVTNWTAAALTVGTVAAAVALAHQALPAAGTAAGTAASAGISAGRTGTSAGQAGTSTHGANAPQVTHSVATTTASGVTVTTTTRTANGKTVVTQVLQHPEYGDN